MGHKYEPFPRKGDIYEKAWGYELWIINHDAYCGKLLVFKKDKKFSMHYHMIKEESWYVSKGEFEYRWIDTETATPKSTRIVKGDVVDLERGQPHQLIELLFLRYQVNILKKTVIEYLKETVNENRILWNNECW